MRRRQITEVMRDEMVMRDRIASLLEPGSLTIPTLAEQLAHPSDEVVFWVMAMRRYGMVAEDGKADGAGYIHYRLTDKARSELGR